MKYKLITFLLMILKSKQIQIQIHIDWFVKLLLISFKENHKEIIQFMNSKVKK